MRWRLEGGGRGLLGSGEFFLFLFGGDLGVGEF